MHFTTKQIIYLLLAAAGLVGTWYFNIKFFTTADDPSLLNYIAQTRTTFPAKSFNIDLLICLLTFFAWYIPEAIKLKMKNWWVFIILSYGIAFAFAFPLFLFFRERKMLRNQMIS
ncbi:MAG: DUF2834 domain-containing protein [Chitinophagales bacterium]